MDTQADPLLSLAEQWWRRARRNMADANDGETQAGKQQLEYGAQCLLNCSVDLIQALQLETEPTLRLFLQNLQKE